MAKRSLQKTNARMRFAGLPERLPRTEPGTVLPFDTDKFILETMAALKRDPDLAALGGVSLQEVQAWTMPVARCGCGVSGPLIGANRCIDRGVWIWRCPGCDCHLIEGTHFPKLFPAPEGEPAAPPTSSGPGARGRLHTCDTCLGEGIVDEALGGDPRYARPDAECPDCGGEGEVWIEDR